MSHRIKVASLIGPLLAIDDQVDLEYDPSAHPDGEHRFWTINLLADGPFGLDPVEPNRVAVRPSNRLPDLVHLFRPSDVNAAISRAPFVQMAIGDRARSLDQRLALLALRGSSVPGHCIFIPSDLLTRYAIIDAGANAIRIELSLSDIAACQGHRTILNLTLPFRGPITGMMNKPLHVQVPPEGLPAVTISRRYPETRLR
jgi:hypothetical protein